LTAALEWAHDRAMRYRWLARGAFVVVAGVGMVSCGGGSNDTGRGGTTGVAGRGGSSGSIGTGTGGSAAGTTGTGGVTACGTVEPCGGGPLDGLWTFTTECVDVGEYSLLIQQDLACPQAKVTLVEINNSLSNFSFGGNNYNLLENITARITFNMPMSCIGGQTCDQWATIQSLTQGAAFACGDSSTNCVCTETFSDSSSDNGTYTVSGSNIYITSGVTGATSEIGYCIQGDSTIHFITVDPNMHTGPGGQATIFKDTVAQRQ
jgi:hypothetical protein